jgi:hypothetical protein
MMKLRAYFTLETPARSPEELKPLWRGVFVPAALAVCPVLIEQCPGALLHGSMTSFESIALREELMSR